MTSPIGPIRYLSTLAFGQDVLHRIGESFPRVVVDQITTDDAATVPADLWAEVQVLHTSSVLPPEGAAPRLRWIQLDTSGADHLRNSWVWESGIEVTTLGGVGPVAMAEYVLFSVLGMAHRLPALIQAQARSWWPAPRLGARMLTPAPVRDTTMVILGYGRIGSEIARLACPFGISVIGVTRSGGAARSAVTADAGASAYDGRGLTGRPAPPAFRSVDAASPIKIRPDGVVVVGPERLDEVLPLADWLVVVLPRTPETLGMVDADRLSRLKPTAVLVNASRGGIVDESALLAALEDKHLAGAVLDVFENEPLEPESVWWKRDDVLVTPHVAGLTADYGEHVEHILAENLGRFLAAVPLMNAVDKERGY